MGKGGGGTTTNTIQNATPWVGAQPFILDVLSRANAAANKPPAQFFPGSTVAGTAPETILAQQMGVNRATAGSPLETAAQAENLRTVQGQYLGLSPAQPLWNATMRGDFLNSNPNLDAMVARAFRPVTTQFTDVALPGVSSMFSQAGRYGSGAQQTALQNLTDVYGRTLGDISANIYGTNYANERQLQATAAQNAQQAFGAERLMQQQATGMAPSTAATDWRNIGMLQSIGTDRTTAAQAIVNDAVARFNFGQQAPAAQLAQYAQLISGQPAPTSTSTIGTLPPTNPLTAAAGGAMLGGAAGSMLGGTAAGAGTGAAAGASTGSSFGPWGALIGGLLGYLGSQ